MELKWFFIALACVGTSLGIAASISAARPTTCCDNIEEMSRMCMVSTVDVEKRIACMDKSHEMLKECGCNIEK